MELGLMFRVKGTVILTIWWQILLMVLYTAGLVWVHKNVDGVKIDFPQTLIPVLGVVTGLLLVFRTNTAYDRYWEGRKLWSTMTLNIRTLTRCFWVLVKEREDGKDGNGKKVAKEDSTQLVVEKISAINLLVAFAYATKHYLRKEYLHDEKDLHELISHIPKFSTPSSNQPLDNPENGKLSTKNRGQGSWGNRDTRQRVNLTTSETNSSKQGQSKAYNLMAYDKPVPTNIPIELSYYIASYINSVEQNKLVEASAMSVMNNALNNLVDCLGGFERILRTPIPLAYSVHLHQLTWIFILALPYQLMKALDWFTIPVVGLAAFALLGILAIGWEIENPFGYDPNDLPLDDFCKVIHLEILTIIGHPMPTVDSWLLSEKNHPFFPDSNLTASELMETEDKKVWEILKKTSNIRLSKWNLGPENGSDPDLKYVWVSGASNIEELREMIPNAKT